MAQKGQSITNRVTGETITWLATSKDTEGKYLELALQVQAGRGAAANHIHPTQDEYFDIRRGSISIRIGNEYHILKSGQTIKVPKGTPHQWWNASDKEELFLVIVFNPASVTEVFFEQFYGLSNDGKNNPDGTCKFMQ